MKPSSLPAFRSVMMTGALLCAAALFSSCTSVQVTNDNKTIGEYKLGYLVVQSTQPFETVREATKKGFKDMGYFLVQDELELPGKCELRARTPNDTTVNVSLESLGASLTKVKIRHGLKGELAPEQQLYQAIARNF